MADPPSTDPFLQVQTDVLTTLTQTRTLFSSFLRIRTLTSSTRPSASEELRSARRELEENIGLLEADLEDLRESVAAVEGDPYRYGLDVAEVGRRKGFVREVGGEVVGMRREVFGEGDEGGGGNNIAAGAQGLPSPGGFDVQQDEEYEERRRRGRRRPGEGDGDEENDDDYAAEFEAQQQEVMMREQDEQLDSVYQSVGVLRNQAEDMGRELEEQGHMLQDVDTLADRVGGKLQVGVKKVGEVIRKNEDGLSSCCIAVLVMVLILLLILVIVI